MGRELKRVVLDFDWPLHKVWDGYVNPYYRKCDVCDGRGETTAGRRLGTLVRMILQSGEDSAQGRNHPYFTGHSPLNDGVTPSPDMVELTTGLAGRAPRTGLFGHDSCDSWAATKKIIEAAGLDPETWGRCAVCGGEGDDPSVREAYE